MAISDLSNATTGRPRRSGALTLPLIGTLTLAAIAAGFISYVLWPRWPGPTVSPDAPALPITIAGTPFNVPPAAMRVPLQRHAGAHERVDLAFLWPSLEPPGSHVPGARASGAYASGAAPQQTVDRLFVTISAAGDALAPADRIKTIYPRYAAADAAIEPDGLALKAFRNGTPYQGEDLMYDPATPDGFLVRCSRNSTGPTPGICLHSQRIGQADIVVRFPRDWLTDWHAIEAGIERLIEGLRPHGS
jgi:hypothetical protein